MSLQPRKRFGQNFLVDQQIIERCIATIAPHPGELLVEVGPGREALTRPLAESGADLWLVEIDNDLAAMLEHSPRRYQVLNQDALKTDFAGLASGKAYRLVGNLPYNISTPLLFHFLDQVPPPADMHFMLQKEVVQRMCADPGSKAFGRLSLTCQNLCEVIALFDVPAAAFDPAPKVDSSFVRLLPRAEPLIAPELRQAFETIVIQAFSMRRKTIRNGLKKIMDASLIEAAGIDPTTRPEQLSITEFASLANALESQHH
jgi:16S rRNA (adenine1518-N6/adenine1519-N6)-dimethyltransferase